MKTKNLLFMAIIAFLLPIGLTSCDGGDENEWKPPTEMKLSVIKSDPVLKTFLADGNYPNKTLIASFNYDDGFKYGKRWENDSINEPDTPIYNIILNKKYIGVEDALYLKGRYNFTLNSRAKGRASDLVDGKNVMFDFYYVYDINFTNKTLVEALEEIKSYKYQKSTYRIDIFVQNK